MKKIKILLVLILASFQFSYAKSNLSAFSVESDILVDLHTSMKTIEKMLQGKKQTGTEYYKLPCHQMLREAKCQEEQDFQKQILDLNEFSKRFGINLEMTVLPYSISTVDSSIEKSLIPELQKIQSPTDDLENLISALKYEVRFSNETLPSDQSASYLQALKLEASRFKKLLATALEMAQAKQLNDYQIAVVQLYKEWGSNLKVAVRTISYNEKAMPVSASKALRTMNYSYDAQIGNISTFSSRATILEKLTNVETIIFAAPSTK